MRILVDAMLGKLGRWLRMMGQDTEISSNKLSDHEIVEWAEEEDRVLVTRDTDIAKMNTEINVVFLKDKGFEKQIKKVFEELGMDPGFPRDARCPNCNGELKSTGENKWVCKECGQKYWKGSHWKRIKEIKRELECS